MSYDSIVVGGGAAGAVVAARLSEDRDHRVLLLEAGPDYPDELPGELLDSSAPVTRGHNWDLQAIASEDDPASSESMERVARVFQRAAGHLAPGQIFPKLPGAGGGAAVRFPYPMGKVMGGSSAINGSLAFHARPEDWAAWAAAGNDRWGWESVRPWIERLEMPMETPPLDGLTRFQGAFLDTCRAKGHSTVDLRQGTACGVGAIPKNVDKGRRVSTASLYLKAARGRLNLTIRSHCLVDRIVFGDGGGPPAASGVEALVEGQRTRFAGGQIVLCAGSVNSPAILLRSGIGAAEEIARSGGRPLLDLPGVGKNLIDHPAVSIWAVPRPGSCRVGEPVHQVMLQRRSAPSEPLCDLQLFMLSALPTDKLPPLREVVGADMAVGLSVIVATPVSRGRVELVDRDPMSNPRVHLHCLRETVDLRRMMEGLRLAWSLLREERLGADIERIVLWNESVIASNRLLERLIRTTVRGTWHAAGTLRMGKPGDETTVVDQNGRLHGCGNVTVADASIMPSIPSVPTNLTCVLIGERIAAHLRGLD